MIKIELGLEGQIMKSLCYIKRTFIYVVAGSALVQFVRIPDDTI